MKDRIFLNSVSVGLLLIFILPFIYLVQYTFLSADDFCRTAISLEYYFQNILQWYQVHNGRFINAFLSYLPVYELPVYRFVLGMSFIIFGIALFGFINTLIIFWGIQGSFSKSFFLTIFLYILILSQLPSLYQFFYWYAGVTVYMYGLIFFLFFLIFLKDVDKRPHSIALSAVFIILINGNNEMLLLLTNYILAMLLVWSLICKKRLFKIFLLLNIVSWISSLMVILSPGTINRQGYYPEGANFLFSVKSALLSAGSFTFKSLIEVPYFFFYVGVLLFFLSFSRKTTGGIKMIHPLMLFVLSFIGFSIVLFVPYYATGYLRLNEGRIGNIIHIIFIFMLIINLVNLSNCLKMFFLQSRKIPYSFSIIFLAVFIIIISIDNDNYKNLYLDYDLNSHERLSMEMDERRISIMASESQNLILKNISYPKILNKYDITSDPGYWLNQCYTFWVNQEYNKNFKTIIIE